MAFDAVAAFERSFIPIQGGYLYYPSRWSSGYLVSGEEYQQLVEEWRKVAGFWGILRLVAVLAIALILLVLVDEHVGLDSSYDLTTYACIAAVIAYILWKSTAPVRLVRGREPVSPPRTAKQSEEQMGRALGWPVAISLAITSIGFLAWSVSLAASKPLLGVPLAVLTAVATFVNCRIAVRAMRGRR